jgi:VanZ family protein
MRKLPIMKADRYFSISLPIAAVLAILSFLHCFELPQNTCLWKAIGNAGHIPLFGLLSLVLLRLSNLTLSSRIRNPFFHYAIVLAAAALLGIFSETAQIFADRDADICDLGRDILGAISFLGIRMPFDGRISLILNRWGGRFRYLILTGSVFLFIISLYPLVLVAAAYLQRDREFPQICGFEAAWEKVFWIKHDTELTVTSPPEGWIETNRSRVGKLRFDAVTYPGFHIQEPFPDWSGYDFLVFEIYSEIDTAIGLYFRLHDIRHNKDYDDRYNDFFRINPGYNEIVIPLENIENAPKLRKMEMTSIRSFGIFAYKPKEHFTIYLDGIRLR